MFRQVAMFALFYVLCSTITSFASPRKRGLRRKKLVLVTPEFRQAERRVVIKVSNPLQSSWSKKVTVRLDVRGRRFHWSRTAHSLRPTLIAAGATTNVRSFTLPTAAIKPERFQFTVSLSADPGSLIDRKRFSHRWVSTIEATQNLAEAWDGHVPTSFRTKLFRVRYNKKGPGWATAPNFGFWGAVDYQKRKHMYITEFWGPHGTGQYRADDQDWRSFYRSDQRPRATTIRNVFLFNSGNSGCGTPSIATGQDDTGPFVGRDVSSRMRSVRVDSWPGQLAMQYRLYRTHFNPANTLMAMCFQNQYQAGTSSHELRKIARGFVDYLKSRTDNFRAVRVVWLGGASRGGALSFRLAKFIKQGIIDGSIHGLANMKIIVTTADAVSTRRDDLCYRSPVYLYNRASDGNKHDLEALFPHDRDGGRWTRNLHIKQVVGSARGMDSMVHGGYRTYRDGLAGNFYTQTFYDRSHKTLCCRWRQQNGIEPIQFVFQKAWGIRDLQQRGM